MSDAPVDFIRRIVADDVRAGKHDGRVVTRFPPEPNGYLHLGHAWAISVNFEVAAEHQGVFHLRFDDTNPSKEESEFVESMQEDIRWLGYDWGDKLFHASDYFGRLHDFAVELVRNGRAYVCDLSAEEIRAYRGTLTEPGRDSPYRGRPVEENLDLFARMRAGEFDEGERVLRARIDMSSPNINLRDPVLYRIQKVVHHRTGGAWCIYPTYDFSHPLSDAIEGITHSLCDLQFEDHRPLYDWLIDAVDAPGHPQQIEFARLNFTHAVLSKRVLARLVEGGHVSGWDDPRMPTIAGARRRGYTPEAIRRFSADIAPGKREHTIEMERFEFSVREDLNRRAPRAMAVLDPLRVVVETYPEDQVEELEAVNNPEDAAMGTRRVPFSRVLYIERDDFREDPPRKYFRLAPGREVRLRYAYFITCREVVKDADGRVVELRCTHDPATRGGDAPDGRRVRGTLHWVSAAHAVRAEVRLYDRLFAAPQPGRIGPDDALEPHLNPESLVTRGGCRVEPGLAAAAQGDRFQFERQGYFCLDPDSAPGALVFNRTVPLRDSWAKIASRAER